VAAETTKAELNAEQARRLLAPIGAVAIESIERLESINTVFRIATAGHGVYYAKFHTARWYADQPDTFFVVNRECAVPALLRKFGLALPYPSWGEYTRGIVPRSVFLCGDLGDTAAPDAILAHPDQADDILRALGRYLRRLHSIEFSLPGLIEPAHAEFAQPGQPVPPVYAWPFLADPAAADQADALQKVPEAQTAGALTAETAASLKRLLADMAQIVRPFYHPPHFAVGNCHVHHFHVERTAAGWSVRGFYDFEGARAGNPLMDLVGIEDTLAPRLRSFAWRKPFYEGYGGWPPLQAFKMQLIADALLSYRTRPPGRRIPDHLWFDTQWPRLIAAQSWSDLTWYPTE